MDDWDWNFMKNGYPKLRRFKVYVLFFQNGWKFKGYKKSSPYF